MAKKRTESAGAAERTEILANIAAFCRDAGMAETTFGRQAVNDGKLVSRIRDGARVTARTMQRIRDFIAEQAAALETAPPQGASSAPADAKANTSHDPTGRNFRFFDNRQKYLLFVNTCSEKWVVANRVAQELNHIRPRPPAVRVFDAGVGDGTVLARLMRAMHHKFPTMPFYISGKEISLEDVRLALEKMPDRFFEHPATVVTLTNLYYSEAPWLTTRSAEAASRFVWKEVALRGNSAHEFEEQITELQDFLSDNWQARIGKNGNPIYDRPVVLTLYREDHRFMLDSVIPKRGLTNADYDLIVASQPYRARASAAFKAQKVVAPLARALAPGGRLIGIHSCGGDPGMEIVREVWPEDNPFVNDRHAILKEVKKELGGEARDMNFNAYSDKRSMFRYDMHTLPNEVGSTIGTSTAFAAWNAAVYVAQVEDARLEKAVEEGAYVDATRDVLHKRGGLWFYDESYVISRRQR